MSPFDVRTLENKVVTYADAIGEASISGVAAADAVQDLIDIADRIDLADTTGRAEAPVDVLRIYRGELKTQKKTVYGAATALDPIQSVILSLDSYVQTRAGMGLSEFIESEGLVVHSVFAEICNIIGITIGPEHIAKPRIAAESSDLRQGKPCRFPSSSTPPCSP